jgi:hypothetical protein
VADVVTFDELDQWSSTGPTGSYYNGSLAGNPNTAGWSSGGVRFGNNFRNDPQWGDLWGGFVYSNVNDPNTAGFMNQYAANTGTGVGGRGNYAIVYGDSNDSSSTAFFNLPTLSQLQSIAVTNTSFATYSMLLGDQFTDPFGGPSRNEPDLFTVRFEGFRGTDGAGVSTGAVEFALADFRFADSTQDYIVRDWTQVDLAPLGVVQSVRLTFTSTDTTEIGGFTYINTPIYAALDNLSFSAVPEPSSIALAIAACGGIAAARARRRGARS